MIASEQFQTSSGAKWTPDGKTLLVLGGVGVPSMASTARSWTTQLYAIPLTPVEKNPDTRDIDTEAQAEAAAPAETPAAGGRGGRGGTAAAAPPVEVKIDWDNLERRVKKLTNQSGSVTVVVPAPDSHTYAFMAGAGGGGGAPAAGAGTEAGPGLYVISEDGTRVTRLEYHAYGCRRGRRARARRRRRRLGGSEPQWTRDGRTIYILRAAAFTPSPFPRSATSETGARARLPLRAVDAEDAAEAPLRLPRRARPLRLEPRRAASPSPSAWSSTARPSASRCSKKPGAS